MTRTAFHDKTPIWHDESFPCRVGVRPLIRLTAETAVPIVELRDRLSIFDPDHPNAWTGRVRGSPTRWNQADGEAVMAALREAETNPVLRPVDPVKLERRPKAHWAPKMNVDVTIPERDDQ